MVTQNSTNNYATARYIVSSTPGDGNYTTIQSAITAASLTGVPQTIFIKPGTYTEDPILASEINLTAFDCDGTIDQVHLGNSTVTIIGKMTATNSTFVTNRTASFSGIQFQTNSDYLLSVSGTNGINLNFFNCYFNCANNTGILQNQSTSKINITDCAVNVATSGIAFFTLTTGAINILNGVYFNSGGSTTPSTIAGTLTLNNVSQLPYPLTTSGGGQFGAFCCEFTAPIILVGTGSAQIFECTLLTLTDSAISIGTGTTADVYNSIISSSNTNAITGLGTLSYGGIVFTGTSSTINVSTQNPIPWPVKQGGTGASTLTAHGVLIGEGTSSIVATATGNSGQILQSGGASADPSYSTSTYPSTNAVSTILYASSANVMAALATANNGVLVTNGSGVPSIGSAIPSSVTLPATQGASLVLISSQTASSNASVIFTSLTTYNTLFVTITGCGPSTNAQPLTMLVSQDNGSTYLTTGYTTGVNYSAYNSAVLTNTNATNSMLLSSNQPNSNLYTAEFYLFNLDIGASIGITGGAVYNDSILGNVNGNLLGQGPSGVNAVKFLYPSGNIASGTFTLYGLKTS